MKTFLFAIGVFALVGCSGIRPVGPLAKMMPTTQPSQPPPAAAPDPASLPPPIRPTPPTASVMPSDVTIDPIAAAAKLSTELETDSKPLPNAPVTAEISRIKGGVKQN